jgi:hypothetical protein
MTSLRNSNESDPSVPDKKLLFRLGKIGFVIIILAVGILQLRATLPEQSGGTMAKPAAGSSPAASTLMQLEVKGRAPKTGYKRELFSSGWGSLNGCDLRNYILGRDLKDVVYVETTCKVQSGTLADPYTGTTIQFVRGSDTSDDVQIDHVVALGDAWQKGAQTLSAAERYSLANDPLELLAVDGKTNQAKGDADAASWLPPNKTYRCAYVARQIAVKAKYHLWVTQAEYEAMAKLLTSCPEEQLPTESLPQSPAS